MNEQQIKEMERGAWRELWQRFSKNPSYERWREVRDLISAHLAAPLFTDEERHTWRGLSELTDLIPAGMLWVSMLKSSVLADLTKFVTAKLH